LFYALMLYGVNADVLVGGIGPSACWVVGFCISYILTDRLPLPL
jgi:hypothetical protein